MTARELLVKPQVAEIPRLIDWVLSRCGSAGVARELAGKMALVLEEAVMNVIGNAFTGRAEPHVIQVRLDITEQALAAEVMDNGRRFDPTKAPAPDLSLSLEERTPGGLGIHLIRSMVDRLHYRRAAGKNLLRMEMDRR